MTVTVTCLVAIKRNDKLEPYLVRPAQIGGLLLAVCSCLNIYFFYFTENEWWLVWGVIFVACPCHKGGQKLFTTERAPGRLAPVINMAIDEAKFDGATGNMGKSMISWSRFRAIKEKLHHAFHDGTTVDTDPWHPISELVNDYNRNRKQWIVASSTLVFDE